MPCFNRFLKSTLRLTFVALALVAIAVTFKGCSSEDGTEHLVGVWGFSGVQFEFLENGSGAFAQTDVNPIFRFYLTWSASDGYITIVFEDDGVVVSGYTISSDGLTLMLYDWAGGMEFYRRDYDR